MEMSRHIISCSWRRCARCIHHHYCSSNHASNSSSDEKSSCCTHQFPCFLCVSGKACSSELMLRRIWLRVAYRGSSCPLPPKSYSSALGRRSRQIESKHELEKASVSVKGIFHRRGYLPSAKQFCSLDSIGQELVRQRSRSSSWCSSKQLIGQKNQESLPERVCLPVLIHCCVA